RPSSGTSNCSSARLAQTRRRAARENEDDPIMRRHIVALLTTSLFLLADAASALAQPAGPLTLADAIRIAAEQSESVQIARAGESRADAERRRVFSQRFPQVTFAGSYTRTLASEFSSAFEQTGPVCDPFFADAT